MDMYGVTAEQAGDGSPDLVWLLRLEINESWLRPGVTREAIAARLRPLLELPVEHVLAAHGGPTDRAALERALSAS
jgi:hypothetical protein